jgi:hypothetical protein
MTILPYTSAGHVFAAALGTFTAYLRLLPVNSTNSLIITRLTDLPAWRYRTAVSLVTGFFPFMVSPVFPPAVYQQDNITAFFGNI